MTSNTAETDIRKLNISEFLDARRISRFQVLTFILCSCCLVLDGFDLQTLSFAAPTILAEWRVQSSAMGAVFAAGNFGVLLGSIFFTMLADKIGRRPVLIVGTLFFSVLTILHAFTGSINGLFFVRLVAGIGMGSIVPNATALVGEYSPSRSRIALMMYISSGFTVGGMLAGFIARLLIPTYGWRSLFYVGGVIPLALAILMISQLPESLQFLAVRRRRSAKMVEWLRRIDPKIDANHATEYVVSEENRNGVPVLHLFRQGRAAGTVLLWIVNFLNLLNLYFLTQWMATVLRDAGYSPSTAVIVSNTLLVGGSLGAFGIAWVMARFRPINALAAFFFIASISIGLLGQSIVHPKLPIGILSTVMFVAGWCVIGGQPGLNAIAGTYYPTYLRSTGIGWALGVGRIGAIVGPYFGGTLIAQKWPVDRLFLAAAIPAIMSAVVMLCLNRAMRTH